MTCRPLVHPYLQLSFEHLLAKPAPSRVALCMNVPDTFAVLEIVISPRGVCSEGCLESPQVLFSQAVRCLKGFPENCVSELVVAVAVIVKFSYSASAKDTY